MDMTAFNTHFGEIWSSSTGVYALSALFLAIVLWSRCPDARRTLRNTVYVLVSGFIGLMITDVIRLQQPDGNAPFYHSVLLLIVGAAYIRLAGLFLFRVVFDLLRIHPPSILEEILVVVAYFIWAMMQLHGAGVPLGEIITTSAIATAVLAFAMQDTLGNILGGLALQWDHSLKVGDWIHIGDVEGKIVDIKWRAIKVETRNWETAVIPNSVMMKNQFIVLGQRTNEPTKWRRLIWFHVDYSASPDIVIALAEQSVREADIPLIATEPAPKAVLMDIGGSTAKYALCIWLTDPAVDAPTCSAARKHIIAALRRHNIRLAMPRQHFHLTNRDESYLEQKHLKEVSHRREMISQIDLFRSFSPEELDTLADRLKVRPYAESDVIFRQGDLDHYLYIITEGEVSLHIRGAGDEEVYALSLQPGDIFGEIGLMTGEPRAATARALSPVDCYTLGKQDFAEFILSREGMIEEISEVVMSRQGALQQAREMIPQQNDSPQPHHTLHELASKIRKFLDVEDQGT
jgi:small-conductance mechanosensitive channel/CRP-like cAMP-binding protein